MKSELPRDLRKELATFARKLAREHRTLFAANPNLRKRAGQFLTALLPPRPRRRGRPGRADERPFGCGGNFGSSSWMSLGRSSGSESTTAWSKASLGADSSSPH